MALSSALLLLFLVLSLVYQSTANQPGILLVPSIYSSLSHQVETSIEPSDLLHTVPPDPLVRDFDQDFEYAYSFGLDYPIIACANPRMPISGGLRSHLSNCGRSNILVIRAVATRFENLECWKRVFGLSSKSDRLPKYVYKD